MPLFSGRTPARAAALWVFLFHTAAALWLFFSRGAGVRGGVLFWMDFPLSVAWAGAGETSFLAASLLLGGAFWALLAAGLTALVGTIARRR
jgi:hypothetical protein